MSLFALGYGLLFAGAVRVSPTSHIAPIWPPAGLLLAALLLLADVPKWRLLAVAFVAGRVVSTSPFPPSAETMANIAAGFLECLFAAEILRRWRGPTLRFDRLGDLPALIAAAAVAVTPTAALAGYFAARHARPAFPDIAATWVGGFLGMLLVTPLVVVWARTPHPDDALASWRRRLPEVTVLGVVSIVQALLVFRSTPLSHGFAQAPYTLLLPLLWAGFRFGVRGTMSMAALVSLVALWSAVRNATPQFGPADQAMHLVDLQLFIGFLVVFALALALALTERRAAWHAEQRLRDALVESERRTREQKMEAVSLLAGGIAHDVNNLLTIVGLAAGTLRESADAAERTSSADDVEAAIRRGRELTAHLLAYSRECPVDSVTINASLTLTSLQGIVRRLVADHAEVRWRISDGMMVELPIAALDQILLNLVANANDAMPNGGEIVIAAEEVTLSDSYVAATGLASGAYVRIEVSDSGEGMAPDTIRRAFDPYFTTKPAGRGTGLGLATVHSIVEQAGGHAEIDSAPGQGTTVRVLLPRRCAPARRLAEPAATEYSRAPVRIGPAVLAAQRLA